MALFNQLTLCNILNGRNNLGTPELSAAVASMSEEQKDDALVFLKFNTEELVGLHDGQGMQAIANVCTLLDYLLTIIFKIYRVKIVKLAMKKIENLDYFFLNPYDQKYHKLCLTHVFS